MTICMPDPDSPEVFLQGSSLLCVESHLLGNVQCMCIYKLIPAKKEVS